MLILVVGVGQHVGKTAVVEELVRAFAERDVAVCAAKPLSTLNAFYHREAFERMLEIGRFVSNDILRVKGIAVGNERLEVLNPVFSLLLPVDLEAVDWNTMSLESPVFQTAVIRVSSFEDDSFYLVEPSGRFVGSYFKRVEPLLKKFEFESVEVDDVDEILIDGRRKTNNVLKELGRKYEVLVVESSANMAYPNESSLEAEKVVIVTPGKYFVCDGERYRQAAELAGGKLYLRCEDVVEILKPKKGYENIKNLIKVELLNH